MIYRSMLLGICMLGVAAGCTATSNENEGTSETSSDPLSSSANRDLAKARAATAKYHDEAAAIADGYTRSDDCVLLPSGGEGYHYVNFDLLSKPINVETPPILLYYTGANGKRELMAVEYFTPVFVDGTPWFGTPTMPPPAGHSEAPVLFGQSFDGPMPGHFDGMPWHYDLHVWVWKHNPAGLFTGPNPTISCP